ncbi:hypothetical protein CKO35_13830 [Ectothiorhodospira shaposhnikovii]|uniref:DUF1631 domain-containing protein n=1 Tax=Ectothiorhodospira shaposhnikovii TaxID=1054 RepID=UPI001908FFC1|nr:DUF1631 domain-containing protein [Ectothiorhodospira shaposhnikovii]MBK1674356.1 hypothetical protein [Ectothiorhodospira shaposhnikovii]
MNEKAQENVIAFNPAERRAGLQPSPFQILGHCRNLASRHVDPLLKEMLDNADDALFRLAEKAEDNRSQTAFFDAMRALRRQRSTMESEYVTQIARVFEACMRPVPGGRKLDVVPADELSLVASDDLEEDLAIDGMVAKSRRLVESDLYALRRRLGSVMDRPNLMEDDNPLDPRAFCKAFRDAMQVLDVDIRIRLIIYKLFDQYVVSQLASLYQDVNRYLQEMRVLPDLQPEHRHDVPGLRKDGRGVRSAAGQGESVQDQDHSGGNAPEHMEDGDLQHILEALARGRFNPPGEAGGAFQGRSSGTSGAFNRTADAGSLLSALSSISLSQLAPTGNSISGDDLKGAMMAALNPGGSQAMVINGADESAIDVVSMLFEFIFDDPALPAPIKELIGRLQIPLLKVAILDKTFFSRKRHPARRLLSELSRAGLGWSESSDEEDGLRAKIESLVERLLDDFDDDVGLFDEVLADFQSFCEALAVRARQREEEVAQVVQGREQLLVAKAVAAEAIDHVVADQKSLPVPVRRLLEGTWKELLVLIYLKHGEHGPLWQKALNVASLLVWSLIPKQGQEERDQLTSLLPSLLKSLQEGMNRMSMPQAEQREVLQSLAAEHARMVKAPVAVESPTVADKPILGDEVTTTADSTVSTSVPVAGENPPMPDASTPKDGRGFMARKVAEINQLIAEGRFQVLPPESSPDGVPDAHLEDLHLLAARELREGTWLEVDDEELNKVRRMKLSWKSLITGKYFFVNQQGLKVREMTVEVLAAEFRAGRVRVIEDVPVFDRAISRLMANLEQPAG